MKITQEADYALRVTSVLAVSDAPMGAPRVAEAVHIPPRFAMKIFRKLSQKGIVRSVRGVNGGYCLALPADKLTLRQVIEAIDGEIAIRHCLCDQHPCSHNPDKSLCRFHNVFMYLNSVIAERFDRLTLADMTNGEISIDRLINKIK